MCMHYEVLYGQNPPIHLSYMTGEASTHTLDKSLAARDFVIQLLKSHMLRAQQRMRDITNKHRFARSFEVG